MAIRQYIAGLALVCLSGCAINPDRSNVVDHITGVDGGIEWKVAPETLGGDGKVCISYIYGNPASLNEDFVIRLFFPAGFMTPPHIHPVEERVTILRGTQSMVIGSKVITSGPHVHTAHEGGYMRMPAFAPHYNWAEEDSIVQVSGRGPFITIYLDEQGNWSRTPQKTPTMPTVKPAGKSPCAS